MLSIIEAEWTDRGRGDASPHSRFYSPSMGLYVKWMHRKQQWVPASSLAEVTAEVSNQTLKSGGYSFKGWSISAAPGLSDPEWIATLSFTVSLKDEHDSVCLPAVLWLSHWGLLTALRVKCSGKQPQGSSELALSSFSFLGSLSASNTSLACPLFQYIFFPLCLGLCSWFFFFPLLGPLFLSLAVWWHSSLYSISFFRFGSKWHAFGEFPQLSVFLSAVLCLVQSLFSVPHGHLYLL